MKRIEDRCPIFIWELNYYLDTLMASETDLWTKVEREAWEVVKKIEDEEDIE